MKKILCLTLVFLLTFGVIPISAAESSVSADADNAIKLLVALGIMEAETEPTLELTRETLSGLLMKSVSALPSEGTPFTDVAADSKNAGYISAAYKLGVLCGYEDGTFRPANKVTYAQATKALVSLLGYSVYAEAMGGYPSGYLTQASRLDILKKTNISDADAAITIGQFAVLLANALEVDVLEQAAYGKDTGSYTAEKDKNILKLYHNTKKIKGRVTADYFTDITGGFGTKKGYLKIDGVTYREGNENGTALLGRYITAYAKEDEGGSEPKILLAITEDEAITISSEKLNKTTSADTIYYTMDDKEASVTVDNPIFIYNGALKTTWGTDDLYINDGSITIIKSNNANYRDVIFVNHYKNYVIEKVEPEKCSITFQNSTDRFIFDPTDSSVKTMLCDADGEALTVDLCYQWDVLSICESEDHKVLKAVSSCEYIEGTITEKNDEEVFIDGVKYPLAESIKIDENYQNANPGEKITILLDYLGKAAYVDTFAANQYKYGFLIAMDYTKGLDNHAQVKIFTQDGEMKTFRTTPKVEVDGILKDETDLMTIPAIYEGGKTVEQIIVYDINDAGLLTVLDTAEDATEWSREEREKKFTKDASLENSRYLAGGMCMLNGKYLLRDGETIVFVTPEQYTGDDKAYAIKNLNSIEHGVYFTIDLYDVTEDDVVSAFRIVEKVTNAYDALDTEAVVSEVKTVVNEVGDVVFMVKARTMGGSTVELYQESDFEIIFGAKAITDVSREPEVSISPEGRRTVKEKMPLSALNVGDVIQYKARENGEISYMHVLLRANYAVEREVIVAGAGEVGEMTTNGHYGNLAYVYAKADAVTKHGVRYLMPVGDGSGAMWERVHCFSQIYKVNLKKQTVEPASSNDIQDGDMIFSSRTTYNHRLMVVYED